MKKRFLTGAVQNFVRSLIRHPQYRWVAILGALFYFLSPIDIAPDVLPIVGWLDDGMLATLLVTEVAQLLIEQSKNRKDQQVDRAVRQVETEIPEGTVIDVQAVSVS